MTIPAVRAVGAVAAGTGTIVPGMPVGTLLNDILLLFVETANSPGFTVTGGTETWAEIPDSPQGTGNSTTGAKLSIFWARASQDTPTSPTVSDSGDHQMGRIIAFSGCITSGNPYDVTAPGTTDVSPGDTTVSIAGDTTTVADCLVIAATGQTGTATDTAEFSAWTNASLSSLTERIDNRNTVGTVGAALGVATGGKAAAGAYSATTATSADTAARVCISLALKPVVAVGGFATIISTIGAL